MFKAISRSLARRRAWKATERQERREADEQEKPESLLQCDDEELGRRLGVMADNFQSFGGFSSMKWYARAKNLRIGVNILCERIKTDGLPQHPALTPIYHRLAAIPPNDAKKFMVMVTAIINATKENPWRSLVNASYRAGPLTP